MEKCSILEWLLKRFRVWNRKETNRNELRETEYMANMDKDGGGR